VPPAVFTNMKPDHVIAREEIFGSVVSILSAKDLDEAFAQVNGTDYALAGGLFSRSPSVSYGAIVERHPFGWR